MMITRRHFLRTSLAATAGLGLGRAVSAESASPILMGGDRPPYLWLNDRGRPDGLFAPTMQAIARRCGGVPVEIVPWLRALETGLTEPNTLIAPLARIPEREDRFLWIGKVVSDTLHFVGPADKIASEEDLREAGSIGVQMSSPMCRYLVRNDFRRVTFLPVESGALTLLLNGRLEAWLTTRSIAGFFLDRLGGQRREFRSDLSIGPAVDRVELYLAAHKDTARSLIWAAEQALADTQPSPLQFD